MEEDITEELVQIAIRFSIDRSGLDYKKPLIGEQEKSHLEFVNNIKLIIQGQITALHLMQTVIDPSFGYEMSYRNLQNMTKKLGEILKEFDSLTTKESVENFLGMINIEGDNDFVGLIKSAKRF